MVQCLRALEARSSTVQGCSAGQPLGRAGCMSVGQGAAGPGRSQAATLMEGEIYHLVDVAEWTLSPLIPPKAHVTWPHPGLPGPPRARDSQTGWGLCRHVACCSWGGWSPPHRLTSGLGSRLLRCSSGMQRLPPPPQGPVPLATPHPRVLVYWVLVSQHVLQSSIVLMVHRTSPLLKVKGFRSVPRT